MKSSSLESAFVELVNAHRAAIHRVARMYARSPDDRAELFQEVVYQLWRAYPDFRRESREVTWVYRIALNTAITSLRRLGRRPEHVTLDDSRMAAGGDQTGDPRIEVLRAAIRQLSEVDRAVVMCYLDGLSYDETGDALGISATNVGARPSRARMRLRELVNGRE